MTLSSSPLVTPYVIVLDLDGTLLGDVSMFACEYDIYAATRSKPFSKFKEQVTSRLKSLGTIRPFTQTMCNVAKKLGCVEMFIYTASDDAWASFIIPRMESALNHSFNRPLFTRQHCEIVHGAQFKKSIVKILPKICKSLNQKYPGIKPSDIRGRIAMIDNTPDILLDEPSVVAATFVHCPTFCHNALFDVVASTLTSPSEFSRMQLKIIAILRRYPLFKHVYDLASYYKCLNEGIVRNNIHRSPPTDRYMHLLARAIQHTCSINGYYSGGVTIANSINAFRRFQVRPSNSYPDMIMNSLLRAMSLENAPPFTHSDGVRAFVDSSLMTIGSNLSHLRSASRSTIREGSVGWHVCCFCWLVEEVSLCRTWRYELQNWRSPEPLIWLLAAPWEPGGMYSPIILPPSLRTEITESEVK